MRTTFRNIHWTRRFLQRCLKQFLRELDPLKLYFYQSDIDSFMQSRDSLAQWTANGDIHFAYAVFKTFLGPPG